MSLAEWHEDAGVQWPPWQFVEQHWDPCVHASPSVLQAFVPDGVGRVWQVVAQRPVQHSPGEAQAAPDALQEVAFEHCPLTQESEQHSLEYAHAPPGPLQKAVVVQVPEVLPLGTSHAVEQHSAPLVQVSPEARHCETGSAHCCFTGLQ
jgi:hypothetical protein